jgi:hypothetical protein
MPSARRSGADAAFPHARRRHGASSRKKSKGVARGLLSKGEATAVLWMLAVVVFLVVGGWPTPSDVAGGFLLAAALCLAAFTGWPRVIVVSAYVTGRIP